MRPLIALFILTAFLGACTKTVPRAPVEVRHYRVDWTQVDAPVLRQSDLSVQGVVLTPAQWPLEASLKRLLAGDFTGVIDGLDLRFQSARIPTGVLKELYAEGFLPAYVRAVNEGTAPTLFDPLGLAVRADAETVLHPAAPEALPERFRRVDWVQTGAVVVVVALLAVLMVAGRDSGGSEGARLSGQVRVNPFIGVGSPSTREARAQDRAARRAAGAPPPRGDPGLLRPELLGPGEAREGFVLFSVTSRTADWSTARLALRP